MMNSMKSLRKWEANDEKEMIPNTLLNSMTEKMKLKKRGEIDDFSSYADGRRTGRLALLIR